MMQRNIVIAKSGDGLCMAIIENGRVAEIKYEAMEEKQMSIGDIYIGRVQKVVPSLNAAFIDIEPNFPCYYDIRKNKTPIFTQKIGKKPICEGEHILVQVEKEAVKTKAPTVSSNLNFTGNYIVLTSGNTNLSVSSKIKDENRQRLLTILKDYESESYGLIARTNAKLCSEKELRQEIECLIQEYETLVRNAATRTCYSCLKRTELSYITFVRDMYKQDIEKIIIEDSTIHNNVLEYLQKNAPDTAEKLELYKDNTYPLNKLYSLETLLTQSLQKKVWMKSGAYLVIEPTEALTVIDVNSGKCVTKKDNEEQYYRINVEAAIEAAHQIRVRNISGIIIIDFINLKNQSKMKEVLKILKEHLQNDRIPTKLIGVTKLQLVEITRKKSHKTLQESLRQSHGKERA